MSENPILNPYIRQIEYRLYALCLLILLLYYNLSSRIIYRAINFGSKYVVSGGIPSTKAMVLRHFDSTISSAIEEISKF